ncbi:unknown protein (Partial), partial [Seminavis robusta]
KATSKKATPKTATPKKTTKDPFTSPKAKKAGKKEATTTPLLTLSKSEKPSPIPEDEQPRFCKKMGTKYINIEVDTKMPEANGPFVIYDVGQTLEGCGDKISRMFYGFMIFVKMDIRWAIDDQSQSYYKAHLLTTDKVVPACDYNHLKFRDTWVAHKETNEGFTDCIDDYIDRFNKNKQGRFFAHYLLHFKGMTLSSKTIFSDATDDEVLGKKSLKFFNGSMRSLRCRELTIMLSFLLSGLTRTLERKGKLLMRKS